LIVDIRSHTVNKMVFQAREFKANPLRDLTPVLPRKRTLPVTKPVPFDLEVDVRGAVKAEEFRKQVRSYLLLFTVLLCSSPKGVSVF